MSLSVTVLLVMLLVVQGTAQISCRGLGDLCIARFCWGPTGATCINGYCRCNNTEYSYCECLPTVKSCHIAFGADNAVGTATYGGIIQKTYSCVVNEAGYSGVHVVGIYEGNSNIIPFGDVNIYVSSSEEKPLSVILVLVSHEPVNWVLYVSYGVTVKRVLLGGYNVNNSSVRSQRGHISVIERLPYSEVKSGYGNDSNGGDTVSLLKYLYERFSTIASFNGCYQADTWSLRIQSSHDQPVSTSNQTSISEQSSGDQLPVILGPLLATAGVLVVTVAAVVVTVIVVVRRRRRRRREGTDNTRQSNTYADAQIHHFFNMSTANKSDTYGYVNDNMDKSEYDIGHISVSLKNTVATFHDQPDEMYTLLDHSTMDLHEYEHLQTHQV